MTFTNTVKPKYPIYVSKLHKVTLIIQCGKGRVKHLRKSTDTRRKLSPSSKFPIVLPERFPQCSPRKGEKYGVFIFCVIYALAHIRGTIIRGTKLKIEMPFLTPPSSHFLIRKFTQFTHKIH